MHDSSMEWTSSVSQLLQLAEGDMLSLQAMDSSLCVRLCKALQACGEALPGSVVLKSIQDAMQLKVHLPGDSGIQLPPQLTADVPLPHTDLVAGICPYGE